MFLIVRQSPASSREGVLLTECGASPWQQQHHFRDFFIDLLSGGPQSQVRYSE
jgi:hypothetical protein